MVSHDSIELSKFFRFRNTKKGREFFANRTIFNYSRGIRPSDFRNCLAGETLCIDCLILHMF